MLTRNSVGRVAFSFHDRVDIEPVNYVYSEGWLHGRTSPGTKLSTLNHSPWVAFEIDEVEGLLDWRSVVVHGAVYIPDPRDRRETARRTRRASAAPPSSFHRLWSATIPTPWRDVVVRLHLDEVTGRASSTRSRHPSSTVIPSVGSNGRLSRRDRLIGARSPSVRRTTAPLHERPARARPGHPGDVQR